MKNNIFKFTLLSAILLMVLSGCGPTAHVETANNVNFNQYRTFAWAQQKDRRSRTSLQEDQIKKAITSRLESSKGWEQVRRNPDILLSYDVLVERSSRVESDPRYSWGGFRTFYNPYSRRFYNVYYPSQFIGYDNYRVPTKEGTITITMVDARTDRNVLQAWATDEVSSRRVSSGEIDRIVNAIFRKWESNSRFNRNDRGRDRNYNRR